MGKFEEYVKKVTEDLDNGLYDYPGMDKKCILTESSLTRIMQHMEEHDTALMSGFRETDDCDKGGQYSLKANKQRNRSLKAKLITMGYSTTNVKGVWVQNFGKPSSKELAEDSFFIVDYKDKGRLRKDIIKIGKEFEQDSVLFISKGGGGELIGTNNCPDAWPGFGKIQRYPNKVFGGSESEFLTKKKGKPFYFTESTIPFSNRGLGLVSRAHWSKISEQAWEDINIDELEKSKDFPED